MKVNIVHSEKFHFISYQNHFEFNGRLAKLSQFHDVIRYLCHGLQIALHAKRRRTREKKLQSITIEHPCSSQSTLMPSNKERERTTERLSESYEFVNHSEY